MFNWWSVDQPRPSEQTDSTHNIPKVWESNFFFFNSFVWEIPFFVVDKDWKKSVRKWFGLRLQQFSDFLTVPRAIKITNLMTFSLRTQSKYVYVTHTYIRDDRRPQGKHLRLQLFNKHCHHFPNGSTYTLTSQSPRFGNQHWNCHTWNKWPSVDSTPLNARNAESELVTSRVHTHTHKRRRAGSRKTPPPSCL